MEIKEVIEIVKNYNNWRRGRTNYVHDSQTISIALDLLTNHVEVLHAMIEDSKLSEEPTYCITQQGVSVINTKLI